MSVPMPEQDAAVVAKPPQPSRTGLLAVSALLVVLGGLGGGWLLLHRPPAPRVAPPPTAEVLRTPAPTIITDADEVEILAARPAAMEVFRYRWAPHVLVLSFPSLHEQGRMFNRLGAFVEKAGLPRDRVLDDADLQAAIRLAGDTEDTYYYGHDYRVADIARFFAIMDRDGIALHPEEAALRSLLTQQGLLVPGAVGALITLPPDTAVPLIDDAARATILHHELSHGVYFTDPAYAAYTRNFWQNVLTEAQRASFRHFLGGEGYDTTNEDLMMNEAQAYLIHTPDPRYFRPELAGLSETEAARLRQIFLAGMPTDWVLPVSAAHTP